jgi:hypothetical protein
VIRMGMRRYQEINLLYAQLSQAAEWLAPTRIYEARSSLRGVDCSTRRSMSGSTVFRARCRASEHRAWPTHRRTSLAVNSGPLSEHRCSGGPWRANRSRWIRRPILQTPPSASRSKTILSNAPLVTHRTPAPFTSLGLAEASTRISARARPSTSVGINWISYASVTR